MNFKRFAQYSFLYVVLSSLAMNFLTINPYLVYAGVYLPPIAMLFIKRYPVKSALSLNPISAAQLLFTIAFTICGTIVYITTNLLLDQYLLTSHPYYGGIFVNFSVWPDIIFWISTAVLIEIIYRGIIQNGFQNLSAIKLSLLISLLFALSRSVFDMPTLIATGFIYSLMVYKTNSVIPAVIAHFLLSFLKEPVENLVFNIGLMWGQLFTLIFLLLAALGIAILLFQKMPGRQIIEKRQTETIPASLDVKGNEKKSIADILFIVTIVITVLLTIWKTGMDIYLMQI